MVTLLPRLPAPAADLLLEGFLHSGPLAWLGFDPSNLPDGVRFAATGGTKASLAELQGLRNDLVGLAASYGFGGQSARGGHARFDGEAAVWLAQHPLLASGESLRDDVWAFMAIVLAPDIVQWRFGDSVERYQGGVRNTFQRLWMRGTSLDRGELEGDRWALVRELTEDALVQITERPSIGGDPLLARALGEAWVRGAAYHGRGAMEPIMRRAVLRVRIWNELRALTELPEPVLKEVLDTAMEVRTNEQVTPSEPAIKSEAQGGAHYTKTNGELGDLAANAALLERQAEEHGLLSPKSRTAFASIKAGKFPLSESESNALRHLIGQLRKLRAEQGEAASTPVVVETPAAISPPAVTRSRAKWAIWRKD